VHGEFTYQIDTLEFDSPMDYDLAIGKMDLEMLCNSDGIVKVSNKSIQSLPREPAAKGDLTRDVVLVVAKRVYRKLHKINKRQELDWILEKQVK
jgi:hypothetical protein